MQRNIFILIYSGIIFLLSFSNSLSFNQPDSTKSYTWQDMMDSCNTYQQAQDFQTAIKWALQAEVKAKEEYGEMDTNYVAILNVIGEIYYYSGIADSSLKYWEICLLKNKQIHKGDHPNVANCLNNLAGLNYDQGRLNEVEPFFKEALEMYRRIFKGDHTNVANSIGNLAGLYLALGRLYEAELLFNEALEMTKRLFFGDHPYKASCLSNLGILFQTQGKLNDSEPLFNEALEMYRRLFKDNHQYVVISLNNLAGLYQSLGRFNEAELLFKEALVKIKRIFKSDHPSAALTLGNLGALYQVLGRLTEAEPLYNEALEIYKRLFKGDHPDVAISLGNLAYLYQNQGKFNEAQPLYNEAIEMNKRLFKGDHPNVAISLNNLALHYKVRGRLNDAVLLYNEALEMYKRLFNVDHPNVALILGNLGTLYQEQGRLTESEVIFKEALKLYKSIYLKNSSNLSESEKEKYWNTMKSNFESFLSLSTKRMKENPEILSYTYNNLLFTKSLQFNSANKIKKRILESNDSLLKAKFLELTSKKEMLIKLYSLPTKEVEKQGYNIDSLENIANNLEKEISLKSEGFKQSYEKKKVNWRLIQGFLKPDEAAIEMVRFRLRDSRRWTDTVYYAALIVSDQTTENPDIVILENGKELEELYYSQYRRYVKIKANDDESFKMFWQKIYEKTKDYKKIYFSPDGIYNKLNISTFQVEPGKYLLDFQEIHQLNSTQDILLGYYSKQKETNVYNSAVLIGNPDFTLSQDKVKEKERALLSQNELLERSTTSANTMAIPPLPGSEKEVDNITKYLKSKKWDVFKYTKEDAVKAVIKTANSPRVLHIATHGLFLSDIKPDDRELFGMETKRMIGNPLLRSGLFFAGASSTIDQDFKPTGYDNGFLTAYEAMNLNLDKTELVVLSACETGLGEVKNGEGVYGLQRAFIQAGAKSIIMSLWSVSDEATQELMSTFYKEWLGGKTKREAFHFAQMKLKEKYPAPYYWGAFVMVGE